MPLPLLELVHCPQCGELVGYTKTEGYKGEAGVWSHCTRCGHPITEWQVHVRSW